MYLKLSQLLERREEGLSFQAIFEIETEQSLNDYLHKLRVKEAGIICELVEQFLAKGFKELIVVISGLSE